MYKSINFADADVCVRQKCALSVPKASYVTPIFGTCKNLRIRTEEERREKKQREELLKLHQTKFTFIQLRRAFPANHFCLSNQPIPFSDVIFAHHRDKEPFLCSVDHYHSFLESTENRFEISTRWLPYLRWECSISCHQILKTTVIYLKKAIWRKMDR